MSVEDEAQEVETANGSFYQHYRSGLIDFMKFASETGNDAIDSGRLHPKDLAEVEKGLSILKRPSADLLRLLEKRINVANPSFFDECTLDCIWSLIGSVYLIAQHSGVTDSAAAHAHMAQSQNAGRKSAEVRSKQKDAEWRSECLQNALAIRNSRKSIATSALGRELWEKMPQRAGKPANPSTVADYLTDMERAGKLPKKLGRTASA